ncbi:hypothetical protein GW916_13955, partial [bacterium]|nr:hypothetical protein [bacterium]
MRRSTTVSGSVDRLRAQDPIQDMAGCPWQRFLYLFAAMAVHYEGVAADAAVLCLTISPWSYRIDSHGVDAQMPPADEKINNRLRQCGQTPCARSIQ